MVSRGVGDGWGAHISYRYFLGVLRNSVTH